MSNLSAFLNPIKEENIKFVASKRFLDEEGNPVEWEIRSLDAEEDNALKKKCNKRVQVPGKKGQYEKEIDYSEYLGLMAAACTVYPNLNSAELQDGYGAMAPDALLKKMLKPGEYTDYILKVQALNGFDVDTDELVEQAKNE